MNMHETLAGIIRDAFFAARDRGETMYQASDDAAAHVLSVLAPSMLRLQVEVEDLIARWEKDRQTYPSDEDWGAGIADTTMKLCINELRNAVERATPTSPVLEPTGSG